MTTGHIEFAPNMNLNIRLGSLNISVLRMVNVTPDENWYAPEHLHPDFEFHIIPEGKGYVRIEGTELEVSAGQFYITGPFVKHSQLSDRRSPMREYCLECKINMVNDQSDEYSVSEKENRLLVELLSRCHPTAFRDSKGIILKFVELIAESQDRELGYALRMQTLVAGILIDMFRIVASAVSGGEGAQGESVSQSILNKQRIAMLLNYIHANYKRSITIKDASSVLFLSERQINRLMKQEMNQTFHDYMSLHRIDIAKQLLAVSAMPIGQVAEEAGFGSVRYMYQVFKKSGYATPKQIRNGKINEYK